METFNIQVSRAIETRRLNLAELAVERQYHLQPELVTRYGEAGRAKCLEDTIHHLSSILSAIALSTPDIFVDYVKWVRGLLEAHNIPVGDLARNLICIRDVLHDELPEEMSKIAMEYLDTGLRQLPGV